MRKIFLTVFLICLTTLIGFAQKHPLEDWVDLVDAESKFFTHKDSVKYESEMSKMTAGVRKVFTKEFDSYVLTWHKKKEFVHLVGSNAKTHDSFGAYFDKDGKMVVYSQGVKRKDDEGLGKYFPNNENFAKMEGILATEGWQTDQYFFVNYWSVVSTNHRIYAVHCTNPADKENPNAVFYFDENYELIKKSIAF